MLKNKNKSKQVSTTTYTTAMEKPPGFMLTIIWVGFLVGWLDIMAAFANTWFPFHVGPIVVLRFIASGLFGRAAFAGGNEMPIAGLMIHFLIAYAFTIFFFALYGRTKILGKNWLVSGIIYGILIWLVMNLAVLPMTQIPKGHFKPAQVALGMAILVVMIGIPLSYLTKKYYEEVKR